MTVKDLKEKLAKFNDSDIVVVLGMTFTGEQFVEAEEVKRYEVKKLNYRLLIANPPVTVVTIEGD